MSSLSLPEPLLSLEILERLINLLLEKEALRHTIRDRDFGVPVSDMREAQSLLDEISYHMRNVLNLRENPDPDPDLVVTDRRTRLVGTTLKSYLFLGSLSLLLILVASQQPLKGAVIYAVFGAALVPLIIPLIVFRRSRIHIEHQCVYERDKKGQSAIVIDQLPRIQFQSYLAHEYAHHLFFSLKGYTEETWLREGWARFLQWHVLQNLSRREDKPVYLYHTLLQIIGELRFACEVIAAALHTNLPLKVRRIRTIYHTNPLFCLLTGTPGFNVVKLHEHVFGTAGYFLAEEKVGVQEALYGNPIKLLS